VSKVPVSSPLPNERATAPPSLEDVHAGDTMATPRSEAQTARARK
jgi:hypothetical protein